ncbi:hypothetical protein DAI22_10g205700 [Oryza sativa Japonica Group]|nr:hypothetical protein DAI22_10g205700 [Oryza sativa Japonica Group]
MKEGTGTRAEGTVFLEKPLITRLLQRDGEHYVSKDIIDRAMAKATANRYLKHDMIFLPMNIKEKHRYLAVIHAKRRIIQVLDSMANSSTQRKELRKVLEGLQQYFQLLEPEEKHIATQWPDHHITSWEVTVIQNLPLQGDLVSCGLFVLKNMEHWQGNRLSKEYTHEDIKYFRRKLAAILGGAQKKDKKIN